MDGKPVGWIIPKTINLSPPFLFLKLDSGFANGTLGVKKKLTLLLFHLLEMIKKVEDIQHLLAICLEQNATVVTYNVFFS